MPPARGSVRAAREADVPRLHRLIRDLSEYEKLAHLVVGTEDRLHEELFGEQPVIEAAMAWEGERAVGFALWFHNYSTFLARRGIWLEDLFVEPEFRGRGQGLGLLRHVARLAVVRGCGRFEWSVLDWNTPSIQFYRAAGAEVLPDWKICRMTGEALARFGAAEG